MLNEDMIKIACGRLLPPSEDQKIQFDKNIKTHITLGVYTNGQWKFNVVLDEHLEHHIEYNKTFRWGRLLYVDGKRVYDGCHKEDVLPKYDAIAKEFFDNLDKYGVNINKPTIPYR